MSIVFSSEGLGLFNSTLAGGTGRQIGQSDESVFVNAATGNLVIQGQDENIAGLGQGLGVVRTYNSLGGFDGDNNDQWRLGFISNWQLSAGTLNASGSRIELVRADGFVQQFSYDTASKKYISKQGRDAHDVLTVNADGTALLATDGSKGVQQHYNANKTLSAITNPYGQGITLSYTGDKVTSIATKTENGTETTTLTYNTAGLLASVKTAADATTKTWVHYSYDGQNRLSQVQVDLTPDDNSIADNHVYTTTYTYHGTSNRVHTVSQSDGTAITLTYDAQNRVKTLTDGENNTTEYFYDDANTTRVVIGGQTTTYRFDDNERLLSKEGVVQHQRIKTEYGYHADNSAHPGKLAWVKDGLGNQVSYSYDARGNQIAQTDAEGRTVSRTYNSANLLLSETIGDSTTHYVYNGANQLRFMVDGQGGVTEYRYNALYQRTSQHIYTDSHFTGASKSIANLEAWLGTANKAGQQRTDYTYDFRGQLQSRTSYSDTTHTGEGAGIVSKTHYVYDIHGKLLQQTQPNGGVSSLTYDGLGRVLTKTDANQAQTSFIYSDATQTISTRYANGLWETQTLDKTGALVSLAKGASQGRGELGIERIYRDAQGRAVATEDAQGARSYVLYDAAGRKRFTVDALGAVTEFKYDKANQVIATTEFATLVNTGSWLNAAGELTVSGEAFLATPNAEQDRQTRFVYNKAGQKAYEIDAQGYVTRFEYDNKGQLSAKTQLSVPVSSALLLNVEIELLDGIQAANTDRKQTYHYDKAGNLEYQINAEGYATRHYYDAAGNQIATCQYKNKGAIGSLATSSEDRISHQFYDGQGQIIGALDADGALTTYQYNRNGQKIVESVHLTKVLNHTIGNPLSLPAGESVTSAWTYTDTGKVQSHAQSNGTLTHYTYDEMDNVIKKETFDDRPPLVHGRETLVHDNFDTNTISGFTVNSAGLDSISAENGTVRFERSATSRSSWPYILSKESFSTSEQHHLQFEVTTGDTLADTYFYGGLDNLGAWGSSLDRHSIRFESGVIESSMVKDGAGIGSEKKHLMDLCTNTTYVVRFTTYENKVVITVIPKGQPQKAVSVTQSSENFTGPARVRFYNNPRPGAQGSVVYFDNYSITRSANEEFKGLSENFESGVTPQFSINYDSAKSIALVDGRVRFKRLDTTKPTWPNLTFKERYALNEHAKVQFEVTTSDSLDGLYLYAGLDNLGSWGEKTLDRHAIKFNGGVVQSHVVRDGVGHEYKYLMHLTTNTTYVVRFEIMEGKTVLTIMPKEQPEQAVSISEVNDDFDNFAQLRFLNNPRPGSKGTEVYVDNYTSEKYSAVHSERYSYDLLGRKLGTANGGVRYNSPANLTHWHVYDATPAGASISTVYDKEYGSDVVKLQGDRTHNGYRLKSAGLKDWGTKLTNLQWDIKSSEAFVVYISVQTELGHRYLQYHPGSFAPWQNGQYVMHPLSKDTIKGNWTTIERNLRADLQALEPDNDILSVNAFLIRGSSLIGNVSAHPQKYAQYDLAGNKTMFTDEVGNQTRYFYDAKGLLRFEIDAERYVTEYQYNRFGQRTATLAYKTAISEADLTNTAHKLVGGVMSSAAESHLSGLRAKDEASVSTIEYDRRGLIASKTDAESYQTDFEYNAFAELKAQSEYDPFDEAPIAAAISRYAYDKRGLLESFQVTGFDKTTTTQLTSYDAFGRIASTTDANNHQTHMRYDASPSSNSVGKVVTTSHNVDGVSRSIKTEYDLLGRKLNVIDSVGGVTRYSYDDKENQITVIQADGTQVVTTRNGLGKVVSVAQLNAQGSQVSLTEYHYDSKGNLTQTELNGQVQSTRTYTENDLLHTLTDANGSTVVTHYDGIGRVTSTVTDPDGLNLTTTFAYQKRGATVTKTEAVGSQSRVTTTTMDNKGRVKQVQVTQGGEISSQTSYTYNRSGKKLSVVSGTGGHAITTHHEYDDLGRLVKSVKGSETTTYRYDSRGNLVEQRSVMGTNKARISLFVYNEAGERLFTLNSATNEAGRYAVIEHVYDKAGREVATHRYTELTALANTTTALNQETQRAKAKITSYSLYDEMNRISHQIDAEGSITENRYDAQGNVTEVIRWGKPARSVDLARGRSSTLLLSHVTVVGNGTNDAKVRTVYNAKGQARFTVTLLDNGLGAVKENRYDAAGQLIETVAYANTIAYSSSDIAASVTSSHQDRRSQLFYDDAGRLRFTLDSAGHITEQRYNEVSEVISTLNYNTSAKDISALSASFNAKTLTYEKLVNALNSTLVSNARINHSTYNGAGQLTQITHADGTTESFTYYDNGLKATYTNQKGATWHYTYDNQGRLKEETGPAATYHYWQNGVLKSVSNGKMTKAMAYDGMGNVISLKEGVKVNGSWLSGAHTQTTFDYDLAGRQVKVTLPASGNTAALTTTTVYNALGQAISNTRGDITTYKSYDNAGRVYRERDGEGYVTGRRYNAFGQQVELTRYNNRGTYTSDEIRVSSSDSDRQVKTSYGTNGLKKSVSQGEQHTEFTYNAFGEEVRRERLVAGTWGEDNSKTITAWTYYNTQGQRSAHVDEGSYLTTYEYNEHGELARQVEYAKSISESISLTAPPTGAAGDAQFGHNREVTFHYDKMGRVTHKVHHNVTVAVQGSNEFDYSDKDKIIEYKEYNELGKVRTAITTGSALIQPQTYSGADTTKAQLYDYDAIGRLTVSANQFDRYVNADVTSLSNAQINNPSSAISGREAVAYKYDLFGNVVEHRVFASKLAEIDWTSGKLTAPSQTSQDRVTQHQYDLRGNLNKEIDANANVQVHHYDQHNRLTKTTEDFSQWSLQSGYSFKYSGQVTDADGTVIQISERTGLPPGVNFNPQTGKVTMSDYLVRENYTYSINITAGSAHIAPANKRSQSFTLSSANTSYSVAHWQSGATGGAQTHVTEHSYDKNGNVIAKSVGLGETTNTFTWQTQYNGFGEVIKDAKGKYFYNTLGQLIKSDKDDGVYKSFSYDKAGRMTSSFHALNGTTQFKHDGLGRVISITLPDVIKQSNIAGNKHQAFDRWGNVISATDEVGATTYVEYNHANQVIREVLPVVKVVSDTGIAAYIAPTNTYRYDSTGNLISKTDANGHTHSFEYDKKGNQIAHRDGEGLIQRQYHDIHNQKVIDKSALGHLTVTTHDKLGQILETGRYGVKAQGETGYRLVNRYVYDELGNRTHETDAEGGTVAYHFDALGNVTFSQDEMSRHKHYSYNREGQQTSEQYTSIYDSNNENVHKISRNYNEYGQLLGGNDLSGKSFTLKYGKNFGDGTTVTGLNDQGTTVSKANTGRLIERTNEHGQRLIYTYYDNGWIKSITDKTNDAFSEFEYDLAGRRTRELKQSWDDLERVIRHETHTYYDSHGRVSLVKVTEYENVAADGEAPSWQKGEIISRTRYTYDAVGNRRSMIVENGFTGAIAALSNTASSVTSQSFNFADGSLGGGYGEVTVENTQGLTPGRTDVTFLRAGNVIFKPDWLDYEIVNVDGNNHTIRFEQIGPIPQDFNGNFNVKITTRNTNEVPYEEIVAFSLTDNVTEKSVSAQSYTEGASWRVTADQLFNEITGEGLTLSDLKVQYLGSESGPQFDANPFILNGDEIAVKRRPGTSKTVRVPAGEYRFTVTGHSKHKIGGSDTATFVLNILDNTAPTVERHRYTVQEGFAPLGMSEIIGDAEGDGIIFNMSQLSGLEFGGHIGPGNQLHTGIIFGKADESRLFEQRMSGFDYNSAGVYQIAGTYNDYYNLTPQKFNLELMVEEADQPIYFLGGFSDWHLDPETPLSQQAGFDVDVIKDKTREYDAEDTVSYSLIFKEDLSKISLGGYYDGTGNPVITDSYTTHNQIQDKIRSGEIKSVANRLGIAIDPTTGMLSGAINKAHAGSVAELYVLAHSSGEIRPAVAPIKIQVSGAVHFAAQKGRSYSIDITPDMHGFEQLKDVEISGSSLVSLNHDKTKININTYLSHPNVQSFTLKFVDGGPIRDHLFGQQTSSSIGAEQAGTGELAHDSELTRQFTFKVSDIIVGPTVQEQTRQFNLKDVDSWHYQKSQLDTLFGDNENDPLVYSVVSKPSWVLWNNSTKSLSTADGKNPDGYHEVKIKALDPGSGEYAFVTLGLMVEDTNNAPILKSKFGPYSFSEGDKISLDFRSHFREKDGQALSFDVYVFDPASDGPMMPEGLSVSNGVLSGELDYHSEGRYGLSVTASDGESRTTHITYFTVNHANPSVINLAGKEGINTETLFTSDITGLQAIGKVQLVNAPSFVSVLSGNRGLSFKPGYTQAGTYSFSVRLSAGDIQLPTGVSNTDVFRPDIRTVDYRIVVSNTNRAPRAKRTSTTVGMQNNQSWSYSKAQLNSLFSDADGDTLSYSVVSKPSWVSWNSSSQSLSVGSQLKPAGTHTIKIKARDGSGAVAYTNIVLNLADSNRAPTSSEFNFLDPVAGRAMSPVSFGRFFSDPDGDALTYSISFVKNDGADTAVNIPSGLKFTSQGVLSGTPLFAGNYLVTVTASDGKKSTTRSGVFVVQSGGGFGGGSPFSGASAFRAAAQPAFFSGGPALRVSTAARSPSSAAAQQYWFTYDDNNRVVMDGGQLENGQVSIASQGQYIEYDAQGAQKLVISEGGTEAQQYLYNSWGNLTEVQSYRNATDRDLFAIKETLTPSATGWMSGSRFEYDAMGRVTEQRAYFGNDSVMRYHVSEFADGTPSNPNDLNFEIYYGGALKQVTKTTYNSAGEVVRVSEAEISGSTISAKLEQYVPSDGNLQESTRYISDAWNDRDLSVNSISTNYRYTVAGRLDGYTYQQKSNLPSGVSELNHVFSKLYTGRDNYLESSTIGRGDSSHQESRNLWNAQTKSTYDANGQRTRVEESITDTRFTGDKKVSARYMRYDVEGKLLSKVTGKQTRLLKSSDTYTSGSYYDNMVGEPIDWESSAAQKVGFTESKGASDKATGSYYVYSNSHYLGEINKSGTNSIKAQHFTAPDSGQATVMARHQVKAGDTLKGLAKAYYGSESLWYIIADVNGLGAGSELQAGVMLDIPSRANTFNNHDSFKPLNLGEVIGDTTPGMPYVPPPPEAGCNAVASVIMIAVAVVATIATAGAAAMAMGGVVGGASGVMASGMAVLGGASIAGAGAVVTAIGGAAAGMAAAAVGGFVGSVASQVVGKAMGVVDSFSLKSALGSGLTAGLSAGAGHVLRGMEVFAAADKANQAANVVNGAGKALDGVSKLSSAGKAALGATSAVSTVVANKVVGNDTSFRWGNVAASALSAYAGGKLGLGNPDSLAGGMTSGNMVFDTAGGIANSALRYGSDKLFGNETSWNFSSVATDAFGNAMGNSIVGGIQRSEAEKNNRNRYIEAVGQKLSTDTARKINGQLATNLNQSLNTSMQDVDASANRMLWATNRNQQIDANAQFAAEEARRASRQQGGVGRVNGLSASLSSRASALESRHLSQMANIQASADTAFVKGVARGEYAYEQGYAARMVMPGRVNFDFDSALAFQNAAWVDGRAGVNSLRVGTQLALDTTKSSFELYGNTFKRIYDSYDAMLDRVNKFDGKAPSSIASGGSLGGQFLRFAGSYDASFAYDNQGQFAINFTGWSGGVASSNGLAIDTNVLLTEKAFTSSAINHVTGYQHTTAIDIEFADAVLGKPFEVGMDRLGAPSGLKTFMFAKERPVSIYAGAVGGQLHTRAPSFNTKFSDTQGYRLGGSAGIKFHGTGPLLVTDSLSFAPEQTSLSVNLGIFGKTVYAFNNLFHKE